jgi:hypothetical protein
VVAFSVEDEVGSNECAVGPVGLVEHGDVRLDLTLLNQPRQVRGRAIGRCQRQGAGACCQSVWLVVAELLLISFIRFRFMRGNLWTTIGQVIGGGGLVFGIGIWLGRIGAA